MRSLREATAEAGAFQVGVQAVPDDDVLRRNSGLLQPLADGFHQHGAGGSAPAGEAVHLQADHFAGPHDLLPGVQRRIAAVERLDGAVEQLKTRLASGEPPAPRSAGSRAITTLDFPGAAAPDAMAPARPACKISLRVKPRWEPVRMALAPRNSDILIRLYHPAAPLASGHCVRSLSSIARPNCSSAGSVSGASW